MDEITEQKRVEAAMKADEEFLVWQAQYREDPNYQDWVARYGIQLSDMALEDLTILMNRLAKDITLVRRLSVPVRMSARRHLG